MAEYDLNEIVRQADRMCKQYHCSDCPLNKYDRDICRAMVNDELAQAINKVVGWAKENPEPKYPTWYDWQRETFPDAGIFICAAMLEGNEHAPCSDIDCAECRKQQIPDEIAKKLGIKPVGGGEDEQ